MHLLRFHFHGACRCWRRPRSHDNASERVFRARGCCQVHSHEATYRPFLAERSRRRGNMNFNDQQLCILARAQYCQCSSLFVRYAAIAAVRRGQTEAVRRNAPRKRECDDDCGALCTNWQRERIHGAHTEMYSEEGVMRPSE